MKVKHYRKVAHNLFAIMSDPRINSGKGLTQTARITYIALSQGHMLINSKVAIASYSDIQRLAGIRSRSTVSKAIKELEMNGFILRDSEHGKETSYVLLKGVFYGKEEGEYETKNQYKKPRFQKNFKKTTSPSRGPVKKPPIYSYSSNDSLSYKIIKKQKHKNYVSVFFNNDKKIIFRLDSWFSSISDDALEDLARQYEIENIQKKVELLELIYSGETRKLNLIKPPQHLLAGALFNNYEPNDRQERKIIQYRKERYVDLAYQDKEEDSRCIEFVAPKNLDEELLEYIKTNFSSKEHEVLLASGIEIQESFGKAGRDIDHRRAMIQGFKQIYPEDAKKFSEEVRCVYA